MPRFSSKILCNPNERYIKLLVLCFEWIKLFFILTVFFQFCPLFLLVPSTWLLRCIRDLFFCCNFILFLQLAYWRKKNSLAEFFCFYPKFLFSFVLLLNTRILISDSQKKLCRHAIINFYHFYWFYFNFIFYFRILLFVFFIFNEELYFCCWCCNFCCNFHNKRN